MWRRVKNVVRQRFCGKGNRFGSRESGERIETPPGKGGSKWEKGEAEKGKLKKGKKFVVQALACCS
jgi:hypothetical protein